MNMPTSKIGILGMGYLGKHLLAQCPDLISWGTFHQTLPQDQWKNTIDLIEFQWECSQTWSHLPKETVVLVLTIPPILKEPEAEIRRLAQWGNWMKQERPALKKMIYISSTGVYPSQDRIWKEEDVFEADRLGGKLRLETEKTLDRFFQLSIIRPGGIYGPQQNIGQRVLAQKPISQNKRPIHRIHVRDLADIVQQCVENERAPRCLNAVDQEPKPSAEVVAWLLQKKLLQLPPEVIIQYQQEKSSEKEGAGNGRLISNQKLLNEMRYSLRFPSFREGLTDIFARSAKTGAPP